MLLSRRIRAKILLFRQLAVLLRSGMAFPEAIGALHDFPYRPVRKRLLDMRDELQKDLPLPEVIARYPDLFARMPALLWSRGLPPEELGRIFYDFAEEMEKGHDMQCRMKRALAYPLVTLGIGFVVLSVLLIFVIPAMEKMYADFGNPLPQPTQAMIDLANNLDGFILAAIFIPWAIRTLQAKKPAWTYAIAGWLPILGPVLRRSAIYLFARDLALFMRLGLAPGEAVRTSAEGLTFLPFARRLKDFPLRSNLQESLGAIGVFPSLFLQVVGVGERSGNLGDVLLEFTRFYEKEIETAYFRLLLVTEVLALVAVALVIGWSVMAMYLPIFQLAGGMNG